MALRNNARADLVSGLHTGPHRLGVAGLADPQGNDWVLMNDPAVPPGGIVNALTVASAATGSAVTVSVGGSHADTNIGLTVTGVGTGVTTVGSSTSPVTLAGSVTVSSNLAAAHVTATSALQSNVGASSSQAVAINLGPSSIMPTIQIGSSVPTAACNVGSLFLNAGGSSTTAIYVCIPNGGTASSSNWDTFTLI